MDNIINVTAGLGGWSYLIVGKEKAALLDAGMAYCGGLLVEIIKEKLVDRKLDMVLLTHSHYDHVGALGFLRKQWPDLKVYGAEYAKNVLGKESAVKLIKELSKGAKELYATGEGLEFNKKYGEEAMENMLIDVEHLKVDKAIFNGDKIDLGETIIEVIETPGHTKCSLTFYLPKEDLLIPSESTGVLCEPEEVKPSILISYKEAMKSWDKCKAINAGFIVSPHGVEILDKVEQFWKWSKEGAELSKKIVLDCVEKGLGKEDMLKAYRRTFRKGLAAEQQPIEAFDINARAAIQVILREFTEQS